MSSNEIPDSGSNTGGDGGSGGNDSQPSMIGGHVKYVQGAASSLLGYESGETTKQSAIQEIKDAKAASDSAPPTQSTVLGSVEKAVGSVVGCEGMEDDGKKRLGTQEKRVGIEEAGGTG